MNQVRICLVPPKVVSGERAQRNHREPLLACVFDSGAYQLTSDSVPCELGGDFRVDEDELARHAPVYKERSLPADVRLKAVIHLVYRLLGRICLAMLSSTYPALNAATGRHTRSKIWLPSKKYRTAYLNYRANSAVARL